MAKWNALHADSLSPYRGMTFDQLLDLKRKNRMNTIDNLSPELRLLVHEYGYTVVHTLLGVGVVKPRQIRHVVETVLNEFSPTRGSYSCQGVRTVHEDKNAP